MWTGSCFCGEVRYEVGGPVHHQTLCHCAMCRRTTGAPCVAWFTAPAAAFRYTRGAPAQFHSSPGVTRSFCARCGTQLTFEDTRSAGAIDVTTCSLDDPEALPPRDHTHVGSQLDWLHLADDLPRYVRSRDDNERV
ncbi:MAG: GFA family protein [Pseudomonadota bacterium]